MSATTPFPNRCVRTSSRLSLSASNVGEGSLALTDAGRHDQQVVFVDEAVVQQRPIQRRYRISMLSLAIAMSIPPRKPEPQNQANLYTQVGEQSILR